MDLLIATNENSVGGVLYDVDGDGDADEVLGVEELVDSLVVGGVCDRGVAG